jgi:uncharacterized protein (DUF362 family)/ferredoxin
MSKVCIIRCDNYEAQLVERAIADLFREFKASEHFTGGEKILLKPNLLSAKTPDKVVTTHPQVFRAVADALLSYDLKLSYGDSPASDSPEKALRTSGIESQARELNIPMADFDNSYDFEFPEGVLARRFNLVNAVKDNDGIVSICKFKTHALTRFTGAMKNTFGLIPGFLKAKDHVRFPNVEDFSQMIADLNMCVKPRLFVMDAIVGMEGNGPANGTPRDIRLLMVSDDPVALDSVCVTIMGLDYKSVIAVRTGEKSGLGVADTSKIDFSLIEGFGENQTVNRGKASEILPELVIKDFKNIIDGNSGMQRMSSMFGPFAKKIVLNRPTIIHENCTRCKVCIKACPVEPKAIYFDEESNKIRYTYGKCIRCFCCQELCPHAAIEVKKAPLGFILSGKRK